MNGITFDTGALIGLEGRRQRMKAVWEAARKNDQTITIPSVVIAEWWRDPPAELRRLLKACVIEPLSEDLAKLAGMSLAACKGAGVIDAIVMASAAQRGDFVYTSDLYDLMRLKDMFFQSVKVHSASDYND